MENEVWKDVVGYEGIYKISNSGKLKTLDRVCKIHRNATRLISEKIITNKVLPKGYFFAVLYKNNIRKQFYIHRLVATHFIPNPENKCQVNHKDGNKSNNNVDNLEWCTVRENLIHALSTKLRVIPKGEYNHRYGIPAANSKIVIDLKTGIFYNSAAEAAKAHNVKYPTMASWLHGRGLNCKRFIHA